MAQPRLNANKAVGWFSNDWHWFYSFIRCDILSNYRCVGATWKCGGLYKWPFAEIFYQVEWIMANCNSFHCLNKKADERKTVRQGCLAWLGRINTGI